jgi:tetratricopeptide (TPR) repeat protein
VLAWTGDLAEALAQCETSRRLFVQIAAGPAPTTDDRLQAGVARIKLGDLLGNPNLPNLGRPDEAMAHYEEALAALRALDAAVPNNQRVRRYVGLDFERLGTMHEAAGRWAAAREAYHQSFEIRHALAAAAPQHTDIQRDLAIGFEKLGNLQRAEGDLEAAILSYRGALAQFELLLKADPSNVTADRSVAISREKLGDALSQARRDGEAAALLEAALRTHTGLAARDGGNAQARCDTARVAEMLGDASIRGPGAAPPAAAGERACGFWRRSIDTRRGLREAGLTACATEGDLARLSGKLEACR